MESLKQVGFQRRWLVWNSKRAARAGRFDHEQVEVVKEKVGNCSASDSF